MTRRHIAPVAIPVLLAWALLGSAVWTLLPSTAAAEMLTVFSENFSGANTARDADWREVTGDWTVANRNYYVSNPGLANLATVVGLAVPASTAQTVTAKVRLVAASSGTPNAAVVFNYRGLGNYLYLQLTPRNLSLRQKGTFTGEAAGVKGSVAVSAPLGTWHTLAMQCSASGQVTVSFDNVPQPALTHTFPRAPGGGVGLRASLTKAMIDYFFVAEDTAGKVSPPSSLAAVPQSYDRIRVTWFDNSLNETGFRIERAPGGTTNFVPVGEVGANQTSFTATGLSPSTSYSFRVQAYNATGTSLYSNTATAATQALPNQPPQGTLNLTARVLSSSSIALSWNNVQYEQGYEVYLKVSGTTTWRLLATVVPDGTSITIIDLQPATEYSIGVLAFNAYGDIRDDAVCRTLASGNGTLQVLNYTGWDLLSVKVNGVEKLSAGQRILPGGYWHANLAPGNYTVGVRVGVDSGTWFDPPAVVKSVTGNTTTQHFVTAAELLAGQWYGVQWNTEPWTEHRIVIGRNGSYTRSVKTSSTWTVAETGTITDVNWPHLSPIVSFKLGGSQAQSSCGYPFWTLYSRFLPGGASQALDRQ